jgi:hypothetical protein
MRERHRPWRTEPSGRFASAWADATYFLPVSSLVGYLTEIAGCDSRVLLWHGSRVNYGF